MKTTGIGTDIIEISRIKKAMEKNPRFADRILTEAEKDYCFEQKKSYASLAGRFAAKEAVAKALGTGFREFSFTDIEIRNHASGKPEVILKNEAADIFKKSQSISIQLSISHCREYAVAFVMIQGEYDEAADNQRNSVTTPSKTS